jgi:DNA-binding GntR family transcriptional regulator
MQPQINRARVRDQAKVLLQTMIADGALADGEHLDEIGLSRRIGVSRTPLREALIALEADGLVRSEPNKGFRVVAADEALVREVFPVIGALEAQAVRLTGDRLRAHAPELKALTDALKRTKTKAAQYKLDAAFHDTLTRHCGNARLLRLLETHRDLARRFDGAHARGTADHAGTCRQHAAIAAAVARGASEDAATLLLAHWRRGEDVVIAWLKGRR